MWRLPCAAVVLCLVLAAPARASDPVCPAEVPAAMQLAGLPDVAVSGRAYTLSLQEVADGASDRRGATITVLDRTGRGWSAKYQYVRGLSQQFALGLRGPYTISVAYSELHAQTCLRTLSATVPVVRRFYAVVNCRRRAIEPAVDLVLRCGGDRLRLRGLRWTGWNRNTATGRGRLGGEKATVTLSSPRQCDTLNGFIYTRAKLRTATRTIARIPIACPLPPATRR